MATTPDHPPKLPNAPSLAAPGMVPDLLEPPSAFWLQQRIAGLEAAIGRTGLLKESRALMTGPSADAGRHLLSALERLARHGTV